MEKLNYFLSLIEYLQIKLGKNVMELLKHVFKVKGSLIILMHLSLYTLVSRKVKDISNIILCGEVVLSMVI